MTTPFPKCRINNPPKISTSSVVPPSTQTSGNELRAGNRSSQFPPKPAAVIVNNRPRLTHTHVHAHAADPAGRGLCRKGARTDRFCTASGVYKRIPGAAAEARDVNFRYIRRAAINAPPRRPRRGIFIKGRRLPPPPPPAPPTWPRRCLLSPPSPCHPPPPPPPPTPGEQRASVWSVVYMYIRAPLQAAAAAAALWSGGEMRRCPRDFWPSFFFFFLALGAVWCCLPAPGES